MSLNALQQYLQSQLDGLQSSVLPPAQAWVLPPSVLQVADNPVIYIWGGSLQEERATIPRANPLVPGSGAQVRVRHTVSMYVQWISENDPSTVQNFPLLLDAIRALLRIIPLPVQLTDPTTGEVTNLTDLGEHMSQSYSTPIAMADQRYIQNNAQLRVSVHEWLNPA